MTANNFIYLFISLCPLFSCIKEDIKPCPPLQINIEVKDKNYFNINNVKLEDPKREDLPFRNYVPTLYYTLRNAKTGEVVQKEEVFDVTGDEKTFPVNFAENLPLGTYIFTAWGGLSDDSAIKDDPLKAILHINNLEGNDLYISSDTIVYDAKNYRYNVDMERAKGKLIVQLVNLPSQINHSNKTIDNLFKRVDVNLNYSDITSVYKQAEWKSAPEVVIKTVLAPSRNNEYSPLKLYFDETPTRSTTVLTSQAINITMRRNELTVLRYVYEASGEFTIYMLVNDNWEQQHGLVIN